MSAKVYSIVNTRTEIDVTLTNKKIISWYYFAIVNYIKHKGKSNDKWIYHSPLKPVEYKEVQDWASHYESLNHVGLYSLVGK